MDKDRRPIHGGILGLAYQLDNDADFCEAVERDLISEGLRLRWLCDGTDRLNWRDLYVLIRQAPRGSMIAKYVNKEHDAWTVETYLLAEITDAVRGANWQRGGGQGDKPTPIRRPSFEGEETHHEVEPDRVKFAGHELEVEDMSLEEAAEWLGFDMP